MNWEQLAQSRKEELFTELQQLVRIDSVLDEDNANDSMPFGEKPLEALQWMLARGEEQGMRTKNIDNMAGYIEMGEGEDSLGILCHVDVVPAGEGWTYPPFEGRIVGDKMYGRGTIDDKGPTMAAWLAMKLVKDAGISLTKRVRMIIGTDEESGFRCVERYFEKEEMPTIGFAPDADFPLINAEKGIATLIFSGTTAATSNETLVSFTAGKRTNMVPESAVAVLASKDEALPARFEAYLQKNQYIGSLLNEEGRYIIEMKGKSAHAMEPHKGVNAAVLLATFLQHELQGARERAFIQFIVDVFGRDIFGTALQLDFSDDVSGPTTLNAGVITYNDKQAEVAVSMRHSVTYPYEEKLTAAQQAVSAFSMALDIADYSAPHYVPEEDELVATLLDVYRQYTGDMQKPLSTGGGTYARELTKGVAFGMLFPGEPELAHQKDEFVDLDNLVKAAAIYAAAIERLAK
ncbi:dipeptidase PepV [Caryophanon tenue]|uniref:Dipeptidase PepV n=1 Tax=Caryophanon tenue TaxID=33978 RepID=A0A1C0YMB5_9BACL|nr:dipeptidase PepV [Caryophanon tenue]OCS88291.1 dipeptidase PepV [Caryophanon tenue]